MVWQRFGAGGKGGGVDQQHHTACPPLAATARAFSAPWGQVLGITNYSYWDNHAELRSCVWGDPAARQAMLDATMRRLKAMKHVGITEELDDSVLSMAADLGAPPPPPALRRHLPPPAALGASRSGATRCLIAHPPSP